MLIRFGAVQNMAEHRFCLKRNFVEPWQTAEVKITKTSTSDPFTPPSDGDAAHVEISSDDEAEALPIAALSNCRNILPGDLPRTIVDVGGSAALDLTETVFCSETSMPSADRFRWELLSQSPEPSRFQDLGSSVQ